MISWLKQVRWAESPEGAGWPLAIVIASVSFAMVACFSPPALPESPWTAAAAIATTFAASVALWLGLAENRRRKEHRAAKTRLCCAAVKKDLDAMSGSLEKIVRTFEWFCQMLESTCDYDPPIWQIREHYARIFAAADGMRFGTYELVRGWLPDIDEGIAAAMIGVEARVGALPDEARHWLSQITDNRRLQWGWLFIASCCLLTVKLLSPLISDLRRIQATPNLAELAERVTEIEARLKKAKLRFQPADNR